MAQLSESNLRGNTEDRQNKLEFSGHIHSSPISALQNLHEGHYRTPFYFPFRSSIHRFHPRSPRLEGRVDVYSVSSHIQSTHSPSIYVCLGAFGAMDHLYSFYSFFSSRFVSVFFYSSDILRACSELFVGKGVVWDDLTDPIFFFS